jgi:hypothetical protein
MSAQSGPQRVSAGHVEWLADRCSPRDWAILETVNRLRLANGLHLERLHFADLTGKSRSVTRWRVLKRLTDWRLIVPLDRRVGGIARGSAGMVFALDSAGQRLLRTRQGAEGEPPRLRRPGAPGERSVRHTLAVSQLAVELVEQSWLHGFDLADFLAEPACWWPDGAGGWMKPDAYAVLESPALSDHWAIEVDLATESLPTLKRKLQTYVAYHDRGGLGPHDVMPRVLVTVPHERREHQARELVARLPGADRLVHVVQHEGAAAYLADVLCAPDEEAGDV